MFRIISLILALALSGCATINSEYDCPRARGMQCKSLKEVDSIVIGRTGTQDIKKYYDKNYPQKPYRTNEKTVEIWMAPYTDSQDVFHAEKRVHRKTRSSNWDVRS